MASSNHEAATADTVGKVAESECLLRGEVGDLATLLTVAGVSVEHNTSDLVFDGRRKTLDGSGHDGCALRVATGNDDGVGAFGGGQIEEALSLAVGGARGTFGESVGADAGSVGASNTLAGNIAGAVGGLQTLAGGGTNGRTLLNEKCQLDKDAYIGTMSVLTMLPTSVEPRAKMNVMGRQLPLVSSLTVEPTRVPNCLRSTAAGRAAAEPARRATAAVNFMFAVGLLLEYLLNSMFVIR